MADNVQVTQGSGTLMATDDVDGVQYPRVKVSIGTDGTAQDVSSTNPMPVDGSGVVQPVSGPLTNTELRASPVPSSVAVASSVTILNLTTAALGSSWTAFSSQSCTALDIVNNTSIAIEYRRNGSGNPMQITSGAGRLVVGITNANQIEVRRVDLSDTQVIIQAEAITV